MSNKYQRSFDFAIVAWVGGMGLDAKQYRAYKRKIKKRADALEYASLSPEEKRIRSSALTLKRIEDENKIQG